MIRYPIVLEAGWAWRPVWKVTKNFVPTGIRSPDRPARSESLYKRSNLSICFTSSLSDRFYISHCSTFTLLLIGSSLMRYKTIKVHFKPMYELFIFRSVCINNEKRLLCSSCSDRLSVSLSLHVYVRLPMEGIFWNLTLGASTKTCQKYIWLKSD
jgi:hypothetical protein